MGVNLSDTDFAARKKSYDLLVDKVAQGNTLSPSELTAMARFEDELKQNGLDLPESFASPDEVAVYSGYKVRTIYNAVKQGKLPRLADGSFSRSDVDAYLASKGRQPQVRDELDEIYKPSHQRKTDTCIDMLKKTMKSVEDHHFFISTTLSGTVLIASIIAVAFSTLALNGSRFSRQTT